MLSRKILYKYILKNSIPLSYIKKKEEINQEYLYSLSFKEKLARVSYIYAVLDNLVKYLKSDTDSSKYYLKKNKSEN